MDEQDERTDEPIELVPVEATKDVYTAEVLASLLQRQGIQASVSGSNLQDEVAAAQRVANTLGSVVLVPKDDLEEARRILTDLKSSNAGEDEADASVD